MVFSYKNKEIKTEFKLGDQQTQVLKSLIDFVLSDAKAITLQGRPGTGKTSIIGYLQIYFKEKFDFVYLAPTHAATAELAFHTSKTGNKTLPATIASSLNYNKDKKRWYFSAKIKDRFVRTPVFVIDEISMTDNEDIKKLIEANADAKIQGKIIFMGDLKQISKVDNGYYKLISSAFFNFRQLTLSKVYRQSDKEGIALLSKMAEQTEFKLFKCKNTDNIKFLGKQEFNTELINDIEVNLKNLVIIAYSNRNVKAINGKIRSLIGMSGSPKKGEILMGYLGYASKQIEKGDIANSIRFKLENMEKNGSIFKINCTSDRLTELKSLGVDGIKSEYYTYYYQMSCNDSLDFDDLEQSDYNTNNEFVSKIFKELHNANCDLNNKNIAYNTYLSIITDVSNELRKVSVGSSYVYNPKTERMELYDAIAHKHLKTKGQGSLLIEKDIDYGYAITCHKSQGLTIPIVYFCANTLPKQDVMILDDLGDQITTEKQSLAYVSMSRYRDKLIVLTDDNEFYDI